MQNDFYNKYWQNRGPSRGLRLRYKIFLQWIKAGDKVLDLGGGDGHLGELLKNEKKCQVTVMDISQAALAIAKERGLNTVIGNLEDNLPFADKSFEVVILSEIVEHLIDSEKLINEAARLSNQHIFLSLPNSGYLKYRLQLLTGHFPKQWLYHPKEHLRFWTLSDLKKMINKLDLDIVSLRASGGRRYLRDLWPGLFAEQICYKLEKKL